MATKESADKIKAGRTVGSTLESAMERIADGLAARFDTPKSATTAVVTSLVVGMKSATGQLAAAEEAHNAELADDTPVRAEREAKIREVARWIPKIRSDAHTHHGESGVAELGIDGDTPEDGQLLAQYATTVRGKLERWRARPSDLGPDEKFEAARWAVRLGRSLDGLTAALEKGAKETGEAKVTLTARLAATEAFDRTFSAVANVATALLRSVGEQQLADRVRPSAVRPGRTLDQEREEREEREERRDEPVEPTG